MTQYGYEPLSPDDSGSTLLERVNGVVPALLTNHKGAARPVYVQPGMMWIDDSGALWLLNVYDGNSDVLIAAINPDTHVLVASFVPLTRKLRLGSGLYLDDAPGADAAPAEGDLSTDRLIRLAFATPAEAIAGILTGKPVDPASLAAAIAAHSSSIPPGAVIGFDLDEPPDDFIVGDGSAISVAAYPELDAAMYCGDANNATATAWYRCTNPASPTTTRSTTGGYIVTRDWRGVFPRFLDGGRGLDSGRVLGSYQADAFASHTHSVAPSWRSAAGTSGGWSVSTTSGNSAVASSIGATGGTETRPKNVALLGCIKC